MHFRGRNKVLKLVFEAVALIGMREWYSATFLHHPSRSMPVLFHQC